MKKHVNRLLLLLSATAMMLSGCGTPKDTNENVSSKAGEPVHITTWNYYNGTQKIAFDDLVTEFNNSVGEEKGIFVNAISQSGIGGLAEELTKSVEGKAGAQPIPDIVQVYPEVVFKLDELGMLANLDDYFTKEELQEYVPSFIEEGRVKENGPLVNFPISKSMEVFVYNKTYWDKFKTATGASESELETIEGIVEVSKKYYEWTDSLTPDIKNDGKAFFGRDSMDNYMVIGAKQFDQPIFSVADGKGVLNLNKDVMRTLWDNYYIPFINGYFASEGNYSSDDAKTGVIVSLVGSTTGIAYFPDKVTVSDNESFEIESVIAKAPLFKNAKVNATVQQGAGYSVINNSEDSVKASVEFIKWITMEEQNIKFSISTGYLPVKKAACNEEKIKAAYEEVYGSDGNEKLLDALIVALETLDEFELYAGKPFEGTEAGRNMLKDAIKPIAMEDRTKVVELMGQGMSREEAVAKFSSDDYFDAWYAKFNGDLSKALK